MGATIKDVAKAANVSIATVSLVIHNHKRISKETKNKVLKTIERLNYTPSRSARELVTKRTGNIGFIITNDHFLRNEPFYTQIFIGLEMEAKEHDYYILLEIIKPDTDYSNSLPRFILNRDVDGIVVAGKIPGTLIDKFHPLDIPTLFIDYIPNQRKFSTITIDNKMGGFLAVDYLIKLGHRNIAFAGGDIKHPSISDRLIGYNHALEKANIEIAEELIEISENYPGRLNGYNAAKKLFSVNGGNITAIFACNDAMAYGAIQYLKENNIQVPKDVSVIGFDDVLPNGPDNIPLSTVSVPKIEMGIESMKLISKLITDKNGYPQNIMVPVKLLERQSTIKLKI